jgi:hypothetical protein
MKLTIAERMRWAGLPAIAAGFLFIVIQIVHPPDILSSVTTGRWASVHSLGVTMSLLALLGITGIYASQVEQAGWLGLAGYLLFSLFWALTMAFQFAEAFVLPVLATEAPRFVQGFLGIVNGSASEVDLGALRMLNALTGFAGYMLGGLLFGIATLRAGILPRWAGGLLAFAAVSVVAAPLLGHPLDRLLAVPMGLALAWLGFALWSGRRENVPGALPTRASPERGHTGAR